MSMRRTPFHSKLFIFFASVIVCFLVSGALQAEVEVHSDFDNGNGTLYKWEADQQKLLVNVKRVRGCRNIWWHFRITGLTPGQAITLNCNHDSIAGEANPVYSTDGENWQRFADQSRPYRQKFDSETVYVARNTPYPYGKSLRLAERMKGKKNVQVLTLCKSEGGRDVVMLRFTDAETPDNGKKLIWIQARQHAFESHGSWVAEGSAQWLASDAPAAASLLKRAIVYVIPIMDVDSVFEGAAGKDQKPVDFNRCWSDSEDIKRWNAVDAVIKKLDVETKTNPLAFFLDLHDPWYPEPHHWHVLPGADHKVVEEFGALFVDSLKRLDGPNSWKNWFIWRDDGELRAGPSSTPYAQVRWMKEQPRGISICMETAHWKDNDGKFITSDGLLAFGNALTLTASRWLEPNKAASQ